MGVDGRRAGWNAPRRVGRLLVKQPGSHFRRSFSPQLFAAESHMPLQQQPLAPAALRGWGVRDTQRPAGRVAAVRRLLPARLQRRPPPRLPPSRHLASAGEAPGARVQSNLPGGFAVSPSMNSFAVLGMPDECRARERNGIAPVVAAGTAETASCAVPGEPIIQQRRPTSTAGLRIRLVPRSQQTCR